MNTYKLVAIALVLNIVLNLGMAITADDEPNIMTSFTSRFDSYKVDVQEDDNKFKYYAGIVEEFAFNSVLFVFTFFWTMINLIVPITYYITQYNNYMEYIILTFMSLAISTFNMFVIWRTYQFIRHKVQD